MPDTKPLSGLTVVVTRPPAQAAPLTHALREAGAAIIEYPVLQIAPRATSIGPDQLARAAAIIFVSANAVEHGLPVLRMAGPIGTATLMMAIGEATATALRNAAIERVVSPQQSIDSEGLLALPQLQQVQGQTIILIRGKSTAGGRTLIEQTLTDRGATVTALECYERRNLQPSTAQQDALLAGMAQATQCAIMALSVETLDSLMQSLSGQAATTSNVPLLVPHPRVTAVAIARGFTRVFEVPMSAPELIPALAALKPQLVRH